MADEETTSPAKPPRSKAQSGGASSRESRKFSQQAFVSGQIAAGHEPHVLAGAFASGDAPDELTVDEANGLAENWLQTTVREG